ncbi:hypothetical protein FJ365_02220 [Candidatus Dependentiae bacterium]|nr:hypothetical protein [Candidatus Dependentiae bacterium]
MNIVIKNSLLLVATLCITQTAFCATVPVEAAVEAVPPADYPKPGTPEWEARRARFMMEPGELQFEKVPTKKQLFVKSIKKGLHAVVTSPVFWMTYAVALGAQINYDPDSILNKWFSAKTSAAIGGGTAAAVGYLVGNAVGAVEGSKYVCGAIARTFNLKHPMIHAKKPFMFSLLGA